ncbi:MAG TPA: transporter substrate-binding domain-containing protein [Clostridia bacterium]|nr:transporter substrate-binding domain-containing protein [Clostridia bacterium]
MKRFSLAVTVIAILALLLTACGQTSQNASQAATAASGEGTAQAAGTADEFEGSAAPAATTDTSAAPQVIKVGTMGTYEPFSYVDASGKLTGYDIEVLRLVEKTDPSLKFEFVSGPWDSLFPGLDSDKFQLLANQITSNPDRKAKYLLSGNSYALCVSQLIVRKGRTDIKSLSDLKGKKIGTTVGDSFTRILEDWNKQNGNILNIVYYEEDITTVLQDIANGRIDATLNDPIMAASKAKAQNLDVEPVGERIAADPTYFIAKKDEAGQKLMEKIDAALTKLKDDGSLSKLSIDWFGVDYSK